MPLPHFLSAEWRNLAMVNYQVDPAVLAPFVPARTELDLWEGKAFVSTVGFQFLRTRVYGLTVPYHRNFEEINLRFYVRHKAPEGWRRGVVFIKEIVPRWAIAFTARSLYNENYVALPTSHVIQRSASDPAHVEAAKYGWRFLGHESFIQVTTAGPAQEFGDGTEEEFIAQHYWGYTKQRDGSTAEYRVEHPPWRRIWRCESSSRLTNVGELYGAQFVDALAATPGSAFLAEGSPVTVSRGVRLP